MKFRTDFVTNSSSANYILNIVFVSKDDGFAGLDLAVSPETCWCEDGDMTAEDISLTAKQFKDGVAVGGELLKNKTSIDELIDLLAETATIDQFYPRTSIDSDSIADEVFFFDPDFSCQWYEGVDAMKQYIEDMCGTITDDIDNATVVISNKEAKMFPEHIKMVLNEPSFIVACDEDKMYDFDREEFLGDQSVADVCPKSVKRFKDDCQKAGITVDNLKDIVIVNAKYGNGDSAMYVEKSVFKDFKDRYLAAADDKEREAVLDEAVKFAASEPEVEVCDNEYVLDDTMPIGFAEDKESLREEFLRYFKGSGRSYWMGSDSEYYTIHFDQNTMEYRHILQLDSDLD